MNSLVTQALQIGASLVSFRPQRSIAGFVAHVTIEERHTDELVVTDHPVQAGADISDHAYARPVEVVITNGWTDSSGASLVNSALNIYTGTGITSFSREMYGKLQQLQKSRVLLDIFTGKRSYKNMLMTSLSTTTDQKTENSLIVIMTFREIIVTQTQATTLPSLSNQSNPSATASPINKGVNQLKPATPSPGGALPSSSWGSFH